MTVRIEELPASVSGVRAFRWTCRGPYTGVKTAYAIARVERGCTEYQAAGTRWRATPGTIVLKQPGDVHHDAAGKRPIAMQVVVVPAPMIAAAVRAAPQLAAADPRAAAFHRLHDAIATGAPTLALEVALVEAVAAFAALDLPDTPAPSIRRALALLHARLAEPITLAELAAEVGLDRFHLCHAFRAQLGLPPYAYLTQLRIARAKQLLAAGARPHAVAHAVGLYDQSQLNRHFRRIVGVTPGQFARNVV